MFHRANFINVIVLQNNRLNATNVGQNSVPASQKLVLAYKPNKPTMPLPRLLIV
jgi:hypothetical protein